MKLADKDFVENCVVEDVTDDEAHDIIEEIIPQMREIIDEHEALGLAAPQVGIAKKFFLAKNFETNDYEIYFNAKYFKDGSRVKMQEGCLSYPKEGTSIVKRFKSIKVKYQIFDGLKLVDREKVFKSDQAIVLQHEIDHIGNMGNKPSTIHKK